jgi:hypothetical protein
LPGGRGTVVGSERKKPTKSKRTLTRTKLYTNPQPFYTDY